MTRLSRLLDAALSSAGGGDICPVCCGPRTLWPSILLYEGDEPAR